MKKIAFLLSLIMVSLVGNIVLKANDKGYNIDFKVAGLSESTVILGHYFGGSMYPDDTVKLDQSGAGVFTGNEKLVQGMYVIFFENGSYFEIIMGADQHFSFETDTTDYVKNINFSGSEDNRIFSEFQHYMLEMHHKVEALQKQRENATEPKEKEKIQERLQAIGDERKRKIYDLREKHPDLFVSTFLVATLDAEVPAEIQEDQKQRYRYYKEHYFDNFDIGDVRLLHTPLYEGKLLNYLDNMVLQIPDSLIKEIDIILEKGRSDSVLYRYLLITLFNKYGKSQYMGMDAVQVHIAKEYYISDSWWSDEKFISDLKERVAVLEPLLIGKVAPDIQLRYVPADHFKKAETDTTAKRYPHAGEFFNISNIDAEFTVLVFWEANCSHCKKVVPDLYQIYQDSLKAKNVQVVAISTLFGEDGKMKWIDFVNSKKLYDWINAWNPYDYKFKEIYDIRTTPQIFVLNKEKEIIGKRLGPENVTDLINAFSKNKIE